jgi:hypothetical protein
MPLSTTPNSTHKIATQRAIDTVADDLSDFLARLPLEAIGTLSLPPAAVGAGYEVMVLMMSYT